MTALRPDLGSAIEALHPGARWSTLPGDASTRRFHRLFLESGGTRIVMDYGAPFTGETDDVKLARIFERAELPVARVLDVLPDAGAIVLEDLGDVTLEEALGRADEGRARSRRELYGSAVGLAARIATRGTDALGRSDRAGGPALDQERFLFEMRYFLEHYVGGLLRRHDACAALEEPLFALAVTVAKHPRVMCHRDYHSRNLMVTHHGSLAMVDIQDARWGPDTYDLASLLRDAYVDFSEEEVREHLEAYRVHLDAAADGEAFRRRFHEAGAQRMIKALGTFGYQISRLGRERYRSAIPRTVERLRRLLPGDRSTAPLGALLEEVKALAG
ncbi:MAG TPA: phosphotransferase [Candidatus Polarisedimenticolaceae bacterium]|nr:phosphotransferase [Candidatus Polarisedimenticolaceae bacterium]